MIRLLKVFSLQVKLHVLLFTELIVSEPIHFLTWLFSVVPQQKQLKGNSSQVRFKEIYPLMLVKSQLQRWMLCVIAQVSNQWLKLEMVCNALCRDSLLCSVVKIILKRVAINSMRYLNKLKMSESQIEATFGIPI